MLICDVCRAGNHDQCSGWVRISSDEAMLCDCGEAAWHPSDAVEECAKCRAGNHAQCSGWATHDACGCGADDWHPVDGLGLPEDLGSVVVSMPPMNRAERRAARRRK